MWSMTRTSCGLLRTWSFSPSCLSIAPAKEVNAGRIGRLPVGTDGSAAAEAPVERGHEIVVDCEVPGTVDAGAVAHGIDDARIVRRDLLRELGHRHVGADDVRDACSVLILKEFRLTRPNLLSDYFSSR